MTAEPFPRDPGLQPERTSLSWNRTALLISVNALLAMRTGISSGQLSYILVAATLLVAAAATVSYGAWRRHELSSGRAPTAPPNWAMLLTALVTLLACGSGIASVLG